MHALALAMLVVTWIGCHALSGFSDLRFEDQDDPSAALLVELANEKFERVDVLLSIDNSRSMADKQALLGPAVTDLIEQLINPPCVDSQGQMAPTQPDAPEVECLDGYERSFAPVRDLHIGVVSSSLGGHGSDACDASNEPSENDHGRLITRSGASGELQGYQELGFLAWDPDAKLEPPGEDDAATLTDELGLVVEGAGEMGCGFEASLESWYRFLVDPNPYYTIEVENDQAVLAGTDDLLLAQRKAFLRPDSLLVIIMLSDEDDCSIRDGSQFYLAAQIYDPGSSTAAYHLPKPRPECATDPNDSCCASCGDPTPEGCPPVGDACDGALDPEDDHVSLRCFDQKRRFGKDFLYPPSRYVAGLSSSTVPDRDGNVMTNPIYDDLDPDDDLSGPRASSLVYLTGIIGVPWQDIARRDADGVPDLLEGLDPAGRAVGGFQTATELEEGTWELILGDPSCYATDPGCLPTDPLMRQSVEARDGSNPVTGDPIVTSSQPLGNAINGHEYDISARDDLQFACIFELPEPRDCATVPAGQNCDCNMTAVLAQNPLCYDGTGYDEVQHRAKAYPGIRHLQVLRDVGPQGLVGSICPAQITDDTLDTYSYRPALGGLAERLKQSLSSTFCLSETLASNDDGSVSCTMIEARRTEPGECNCESTSRQPLGDAHLATVQRVKETNSYEAAQWNCYCEIQQATDSDLSACQTSTDDLVVNDFGYVVNRWCYIDAAAEPPVGNPSLSEACAASMRALRFVGDAAPSAGATAFLACE